MSHRRLHILVALLCTAVWAGAIWLARNNGYLHFLERVESALTDARTLARGTRTPPDLVTIVAIDDTMVKLAGTYPLPRATLAGVVEAIARLDPKVIAIDLLLLDKGPAEGDAALAKALAARPSVLAAAAVFSDAAQPSVEDGGPLAGLPKASRFLLPLPAFAERTEVGIANVMTGQTGTPLLVPMLFRTQDRIELSFPLRVASIASGEKLTIEPERLKFGERPIPTSSDYALPISYYGPRHSVRTISAASLIDGTADRDAIQGRIVVIGATATGAGDFFPTPFDSLMPGVEIISTAITHLLAGDGVVRDRPVRIVEAVTTILLPMLLVGLLVWRRNAVGLVAVCAVLLTWAALNILAFAHGIWLDAATTLTAAVPPLLLVGSFQLWSGRRRAQHFARQNRLLEPFHTPGLQDWLRRDPDFLLAPVRQDAAVVFVDLSGFTALSETLDPAATQDLLKEFHALVEKEATRCGGMITSFLGDGAMILFGLPKPAADDATRAAQCAIALCVRTERWIEALPPQVAPRIGFKIGAHFGPIVASRLGGRNHQHITATGDTVNVASRLMEVAAHHDVRLALSDTLRVAAEDTGARLRTGSLDGPVEAPIRGRSGLLTVWFWRNEHPTRDRHSQPIAAE